MSRKTVLGVAGICVLTAVGLLVAQPPSPARRAPSKVGHVPVADVLQRLGAKLERGSAAKEFDSYSSHFDRMDADRDGKHTRAEYVDKGGYMTPQARAGIFRAADGNADGVVTKAEYVLNRIITDEAKAIVQGMDDDEDGLVERAEFVKHAAKLLSDLELAEQVYAALDANADGGIPIPEYLRVWGQWARTGRKSAEQRIAARRSVEGKIQPAPENCPACAMGLTAEFVFNRLDVNEDELVTVTEFRRSPGMDDEAKAGEAVGRIDKDGNGTLTWEEFETAYKTRHANCKKPDPTAIAANVAKVRPDGRGDGTRFAQVFIIRSDKDGDGRISKSEFRGSDSGFERMDKNNNGFIESDELGELHQRRLADSRTMSQRRQNGDVRRPPSGRPGAGAGPPDVDEIFERFDGNRDGKLQEEEVPPFAQQFILPADADGNGAVTKEELEASRQRQQPGRRGGPQEMGPSIESRPAVAKTDFEKTVLAVLDDMDRNQSRGMMNVPAVDGRLLRLLAETTDAKHVVEIGTSNGYSGIWQCLALKATGGKLTTFEIDPRRAALARQNFKKAGVDDMVTLIEGDAHEKVLDLNGPIDIVFLDADKEGYIDYLNKLLPKVRPGGLVVAHNINARQADPRYVEAITGNADLETIFYQQGGGVSVTMKKRGQP